MNYENQNQRQKKLGKLLRFIIVTWCGGGRTSKEGSIAGKRIGKVPNFWKFLCEVSDSEAMVILLL